jgi:hypothetical protein
MSVILSAACPKPVRLPAHLEGLAHRRAAFPLLFARRHSAGAGAQGYALESPQTAAERRRDLSEFPLRHHLLRMTASEKRAASLVQHSGLIVEDDPLGLVIIPRTRVGYLCGSETKLGGAKFYDVTQPEFVPGLCQVLRQLGLLQ